MKDAHLSRNRDRAQVTTLNAEPLPTRQVAMPVLAASPPTAPALMPHTTHHDKLHSENGVSTFWRIFGGTLLSIAALVGITICNQFSQGLSDLRREVNLQHEVRADLIKKDEFNSRMTSVWGSLKDVQTLQAGLQAAGERAKILEEQAQRQLKQGEDERRELTRKLDELRKQLEDERKEMSTRLQQLAERLATVEGRQTAKQ